MRIQLIQRSIGLYPEVGLGNTIGPQQARLTSIPSAGVKFHRSKLQGDAYVGLLLAG
jgi:hypothetical protein